VPFEVGKLFCVSATFQVDYLTFVNSKIAHAKFVLYELIDAKQVLFLTLLAFFYPVLTFLSDFAAFAQFYLFYQHVLLLSYCFALLALSKFYFSSLRQLLVSSQ